MLCPPLKSSPLPTRSSLRTKKMYSDASPDYVRMTALNNPAALPPPYGIVALWGLILPTLYLLSSSITNLVLRDGVILKG